MHKIKDYLKNRIIQINLAASIILNALLWAVLLYNIKPQETPLMLHYNIYFGIDLIGNWYQVLYIPISGLIIFLINLAFSFIIHNKDKVLSYFSLIISSISQLILLVAGILVVLLNQY